MPGDGRLQIRETFPQPLRQEPKFHTAAWSIAQTPTGVFGNSVSEDPGVQAPLPEFRMQQLD